MAYKRKSKKIKRQVDTVIAHVKSTFNNTIVTITTLDGDVLLSGSAGMLGYKGAKKGTPFAASQVIANLTKDMSTYGIRNIEVNLQGPGSGRDSSVRSLQSAGFNITVLRDVTPLPHNGCRPPKKRRV
ncbi:30S ribosomal protein S11 [Candidatus Dependentiae bacterium]